MTVYTPTRLAGGSVATGSLADVYTAANACIVTQIIVANKGADTTVSLAWSAGSDVAIASDAALAANSTLVFDVKVPLAVGNKIRAAVGSGATADVTLTGLVVS